MRGRWTIWVLLAIALAGIWGCESETEDAEEVATSEEYHSPFIIEGDGDIPFEKITFTDVGLTAPEPGPADDYLLEAIAESLAVELRRHEELEFDPEVQYRESLRDPSNHLYCDREHLYVALWRGYEPDRWGYSLWSGCHEQQKFAWQEVSDDAPDDADIVTRIEPLAEDIVERLDDARDEGCFSHAC